MIFGLRRANERRRYKVTPSLIGWAQTWNQPWNYTMAVSLLQPFLYVTVCPIYTYSINNVCPVWNVIFGAFLWKMWNELNSLQEVNSSPPSATYIRQWIGSAMVQIMACRLFGTKPLSEPGTSILAILVPVWTNTWLLSIRNKLQWNINQNTKLFIHENTSETIVCENGGHFVQGARS